MGNYPYPGANALHMVQIIQFKAVINSLVLHISIHSAYHLYICFQIIPRAFSLIAGAFSLI